ncbi:unnamed protein product [Lota lota]
MMGWKPPPPSSLGEVVALHSPGSLKASSLDRLLPVPWLQLAVPAFLKAKQGLFVDVPPEALCLVHLHPNNPQANIDWEHPKPGRQIRDTVDID